MALDISSIIATDISRVLIKTIDSIKEYNICKEIQTTERIKIKSILKVSLQQIKTNRIALIKKFEQENQMYRDFIVNIRVLIKKALESNDIELAKLALESQKEFLTSKINIPLQIEKIDLGDIVGSSYNQKYKNNLLE